MKEQTGEKAIVAWVDLIRVVAIYLVVVIHVSGQLTNNWGRISTTQWIIGDVYGGGARFGVLLFFMISGYLLLPRSESLSTFYRKRMPKILFPLVVWSLIYLGWYCGGHSGTCTSGFVWDLIFVKGTYYHLWFLYTLLSIYLILPVLRLMIRPDTDQGILWYLILLWLIFQPLIAIAHKLWGFSVNISAPLATGFPGYFILGYLLGEMTLSRSRVILAAAAWLIGILVTILGTYFLTRNSGHFEGFFYEFETLNAILASGGGYILLRWVSEKRPFTFPQVQAFMRTLAPTAFGIYLIHVIVLEVLSDGIPFLHLNASMGNAIWSIPFVSTIVFFLSFVFVRALQKVPLLKSIVP